MKKQVLANATTMDAATIERVEYDFGCQALIAVTYTGEHLPLDELPMELADNALHRLSEELADPEVRVVDVERIVCELHNDTGWMFFSAPGVGAS